MADIFEEVEEGLRQDRAERLWKKYGVFAYIAAALLIGMGLRHLSVTPQAIPIVKDLIRMILQLPQNLDGRLHRGDTNVGEAFDDFALQGLRHAEVTPGRRGAHHMNEFLVRLRDGIPDVEVDDQVRRAERLMPTGVVVVLGNA